MLIVWGTRHYGKVDQFAQQYAVTRFGHVWFLPMIPMESIWVTGRWGDDLAGHPRRLSLRSVGAAYARTWGLLGGAIALITGLTSASPIAVAVGAALLAAGLASFRWRNLRTAREHRRAGFNLLTIGTACDPLDMPPEYAMILRPALEERWAELAAGHTPDDVARIGATSVPQAATAYALLRVIACVEPGRTAPTARPNRSSTPPPISR
jgi:hypothetical protein